jgi:acyl-CoA dehydrogenase
VRFATVPQGEELNWWLDDPYLRATVARYADLEALAWAEPHLARFGHLVATQVSPRADFTDKPEGRPRLRSYDRHGDEISQVLYNPGYLQTVAEVYGSGIINWRHAQPEGAPGPIPPALTWAMGYILAMAETGFYCPVCLTGSVARAVERFAPPAVKERFLPRLTATDPALLWQGATWLTEKAGGSDVGAITSVAVPAGAGAALPDATSTGDPATALPGSVWHLTGEKWFASNADADVALALARPQGAPEGTAGLALFLIPRYLPDGSRNHLRIRRLKEKLGVIAVASGEVLLEGAEAYLIGGPGTGFKMMMEAINLSRVYNIVGSAGVCRRAVLESVIYTSRRIAFGKPLIEQPLMRLKLLQMIVEWRAATALAFRTAHAFESGDPFHRLLIPAAKARTADQAVRLARAGLECHGGNGYIEEYPMARLLRDAQVLTVWEGPENVLALDLLRVLAKGGAEPLCQAIEGALAAAPLPADDRLGTGQTAPLSPADLDALAAARVAVRTRLDAHLTELAQLTTATPERAQVAALRLLHGMADLLTAAYLLAEATDQQGARIARLYCERFQPNPSLWDEAALDWFDAILAGV